MTSQNKSVGFIIAAIGGALGVLAFFAMPFFSYSFFSFTGQQIASLAQQFSSISNNTQSFLILWLAPIVAGIIILVALLQFRGTVRPGAKRAAAGWLIALSIIGIVLYVGILIYLNSLITSSSGANTPSIFSFLGAGYWIYIISMIAVIVGASMALSGKAQAQAISGPPPVSPSYPPYQQYQQPPTPTQYPPQYPPYQQPWGQQPQYPPAPPAPESPQWPPSPPNG